MGIFWVVVGAGGWFWVMVGRFGWWWVVVGGGTVYNSPFKNNFFTEHLQTAAFLLLK